MTERTSKELDDKTIEELHRKVHAAVVEAEPDKADTESSVYFLVAVHDMGESVSTEQFKLISEADRASLNRLEDGFTTEEKARYLATSPLPAIAARSFQESLGEVVNKHVRKTMEMTAQARGLVEFLDEVDDEEVA